MTDSNRIFQLDRLYASVNGQTVSGFDMVTRTPGVSADQLAECRRLANLMPPLPAQRSDDMPGSLGLFRGESVDYILAKAQQGANGAPQFQYVLTPAAPLRLLGGNLRTFESFAREPIPQFATPRTNLPPFLIENPEPADQETQVEDLLTLISYCKNNLKVVGGLIAGLVQAMGIGVINAPTSIKDRLTFIQGLLTLLPAPVRTGITFATSVIDPAQTNTQIKFLASDVCPARHLIFDWATGKLLNDAPDDTYSHFIMAQLRLDASLVIEQTSKLERTAVWRTLRKDDLSNALAWASKRASLDSAIINNLPADPQMVATVLREDPTLSDEMRIAYARHLLAFTLSLNELERADILVAVAAKFPAVADVLQQQLRSATDGERAAAVFGLASRWIKQSSDFEAGRWRQLLAPAVMAQAKTAFSTSNANTIRTFLESFLSVPPELQLDAAMIQLIGGSRKAAYSDTGIASTVFLLAVTFLPVAGLQRLMSDALLMAKLPEPLRAVFPYLSPDAPRSAPLGLLTRAAEACGQKYRLLVLVRLVEWTLTLQRSDLIDADVLHGLVEVGATPLGARFDSLMEQIVKALSQLVVLRTLDGRSAQYLVALSLVYGRYDMAIAQLEFYQNNLYKGARQDDLAEIAKRIFNETPLTIPQLNSAFEAMQNSQLRSGPRASAYLGALVAQQWSPELDFVTRRLTSTLASDVSLIPVVGFDLTMRLVKANADRHELVDTLKLASALIENALQLGSKGTELVDQIYSVINWGPEATGSSLEVLRAYVRRASLAEAKALTEIVGKRHGDVIANALDATYRLRMILSGADFVRFAEDAALGAQLLIDMACTYHGSQEVPPLHRLRRTLEGMPGGLSEAERERLANNCYRLAEQLLQLAKLRTKDTPRQNSAAQLILNTLAPASGIDALRWIGGHFAFNQPVKLRLERLDQPYLMGNRSVNTLLRETDMLVALFNNLLAAFPEGARNLDNDAFRNEVESLWGLLSLAVQRQTVTKLSENAQLLGEVTGVIGDKGNERSLANTGYGRQLLMGRTQPRTVIDALRWIQGYFLKQHI